MDRSMDSVPARWELVFTVYNACVPKHGTARHQVLYCTYDDWVYGIMQMTMRSEAQLWSIPQKTRVDSTLSGKDTQLQEVALVWTHSHTHTHSLEGGSAMDTCTIMPEQHWLFIILCAYLEFFFFFLEAAHLSKASFSKDNQEVKVLQLHLRQVMCPGGQLWAAADVDDGIGTGPLSLVNDRSLTKLIYQLWRERGEGGEGERKRERERERKKERGREKHDNYLSGISGLQ